MLLAVPKFAEYFTCLCIFFFFQAEDGIRDGHVTGVQTCALPIYFVTAGYLFVDADKQILRYAGAGHPPLVFGTVKGKGTTFREIDSNGLLLGLSEDAAYTSLELPFRPGDRCLLYTDGMLEAKNGAEEEFGGMRFLEFLEAQ